MKQTAVLGLSAHYHDSAAAIVVDGRIVAAAQEERFSRTKHDSSFPHEAIRFVLKEAGVTFESLSAIVFYDKPFLKFERLLETYHAFAPRGVRSFITSMPVWIKEKLFTRRLLRRELAAFGSTKAPLLFTAHHLSHAASAFYPSPFEEAAILTVDGVGEWATASIGHGSPEGLEITKEMHFPHSVGLLYSAFTYFLGFRVNSGEYKVMGLAPYGHSHDPQTRAFHEKIRTHLVDVREDGSILLNMDYFNFATDLKMIHTRRWERLFGLCRREPESAIEQEHMNLAHAIQQVTDEIVVRLARTAREMTGCENLVMAGGVALNCVSNSQVALSGLFRNIWIQPAAGDAGGALGAALAGYHIYFENERKVTTDKDAMQNACLGPAFTDAEIEACLREQKAIYTYYPDFGELTQVTSRRLAEGKVVGWFQDRMEFGPRALGNRSILADPRHPDMQKTLNLKIKFREDFRPFAPSMLEEDAQTYFAWDASSPYMLFVALLQEKWRSRSILPAVTHRDYSARIQTVNKEVHPKFHQLLCDFKKRTGIGILVNTSFNVRGEPMVCTPEDAYRDFMYSEMDCLVLGNFMLSRNDQPPLPRTEQRVIHPD